MPRWRSSGPRWLWTARHRRRWRPPAGYAINWAGSRWSTSGSAYRQGRCSRETSAPKSVTSTPFAAMRSTRRRDWPTSPKRWINGSGVRLPQSSAPTQPSAGVGPDAARPCYGDVPSPLKSGPLRLRAKNRAACPFGENSGVNGAQLDVGPCDSMVVDDDAANVAACQHIVVGLVDVVEFVLGGHRLVEEKLALAVEAQQSRNVGAGIGLAVKTAQQPFLKQREHRHREGRRHVGDRCQRR